jgi:predicted AlkP superfamily pyrophosphatase or phosphodiesterase
MKGSIVPRFVAFAACFLLVLSVTAQSREVSRTWKAVVDHQKPRLVVVMVFDQFAYDYAVRFSDLFLPAEDAKSRKLGGFRYLMERGAFYADAHFSHVPTFTGPGHSVIMTGAPLAETGIIGNSWLTSSGKSLNCVEDPAQKVVGAEAPVARAASPVNLRASTVGDELRLATNGKAKIVAISIKDRGSVLMAGHKPTACVWFDPGSGNWVTSTWYTTGTLPRFAEKVNKERLADRWFGAKWDRLLLPSAYERCSPPIPEAQGTAGGLGSGFPKIVGGKSDKPSKSYYDQLTNSPFGIEMTFEVGKVALDSEELGRDTVPDILSLSFSSLDYAVHSYGPQSEEALEFIVRSDRYVSDFLNYLRAKIPGGLDSVLIVMTADHGICPIPELVKATQQVEAGHVQTSAIEAAARQALRAQCGDTTEAKALLFGYNDPYIFLNRDLAEKAGINLPAVREAIAAEISKLPGVYVAYTYDRVVRGQLPSSRVSQLIYNGFDPSRSGDVIVILEPFYLPGSGYKGTSHGSPWTYDTHVPLIFAGANILPGLYTTPADVKDIAPTISFLLGIGMPNCARGRILGEMFR